MLQTKRSPLVYNPANQTETEIISNFVVRLDEFRDLFDEIKKDKMKNPPQHFIIQAQRGYGKTTLLLRLNFEIKNDSELKQWLIPIMFDEEQYGVNTLARFWEEVISYLVEADSTFAGLPEQVDALYEKESPEEEIFKLLEIAVKKAKKKIVILLDNFGEMTQKFDKKENQRLREVLQTCNVIRLVGASSTVLEFYYSYKDPFYNFFKVVTLDELTQDESITLLRKLSETYGGDDVEKIIKNQPERIESIRRLTGGVPRTIVLLFEIFIDDKNGNSIRDLEKILDQVTPLYKHRLDNLPKQQQTIIDAIAQSWDAVSTKEISKITKMPSKAVSSQLNQLEKSQLIEKILTSTKNHLYRISERFFNIYYLMRIGRRKNRQRVIWLVRFFELWCGEKELKERAEKHIKALKEGRLYEPHAFYVTQALAGTKIPYELQHEIILETRKYLKTKKSEFCDELVKSHNEVYDEVVLKLKNNDYKSARRILLDDGEQEQRVNFIIGDIFRFEFKNIGMMEYYYGKAAEAKNIDAMTCLALHYDMQKEYDKAEQYYKMAISNGDINSINNLANLYTYKIKDFKKAEQYYLLGIKNKNTDAIFNIALLYHKTLKNYEKAKEFYEMAINNGDKGAMNNLAILYQEEFSDFFNAEKYYMIAIEKESHEAMNNLAAMNFFNSKNRQKSLELQKQAFLKFKDSRSAYLLILLLLWNDKMDEATQLYKQFSTKEAFIEEAKASAFLTLCLCIAKKQYNFVYNIFKENKFDIKDKYKPVYYALLTFMGNEYKDELLKMGSELKQTVDEIVAGIKQLAEDYK